MMSRTFGREHEQILVIEAGKRADSGQFVTSVDHPANLRAPSELNEVLTRLVVLIAEVHAAPVNDAANSQAEGPP